MLTIRAMTNAIGYSSRHLENNDYYDENERVVGRWFGLGAIMLGLDGEVRHEDFEAVRKGCHPGDGEFLRQRHSADRTAPDGSVQAKARDLYDFTFSAPKSVSIMHRLADDPRLAKAHETAVLEALTELQSHAAARVRKGGADYDRPTGNIAVAVYHHDASRELDPQLHTHAVAANLTFDLEENRWKALQASGMYQRRAYITEVYRNALAREVAALGYSIENRTDRKGKDCGFEISGVPQSLFEKYSQRSRQRDDAIERFIVEHGRKPTNNEIAVLVRETRQDKLTTISTEQVRQKQLSRLEPHEASLLQGLKPQTIPGPIRTISAEPSLESAKEHTFERVSVANDYEVLAEALRHGRGEIALDDLKESLSVQEASGAILRKGDELATKESLQRELEMIQYVNSGVGSKMPIDASGRFEPDGRLNAEQRNVITFVLSSRDKAMNISGAAGTGKTATLKDLHRGVIESGHQILAVAPTRSAVEELQKVGFADAVTVERLLVDPNVQKRGAVLIVDEAGMISSRQMSDLLKLAERLSCRVVFSGDTQQIQSVEAGDALRILEKESRLRTVSLRQERRQTDKAYLEAVHELRRDPTKGFAKLDSMGAVIEVEEIGRAKAVADAFAGFTQKKKDAIVVCATHDEIGRVTDAIRDDLKAAGKLQDERRLARDVPLSWTAAHKADVSRLQPGQILCFHRAVKGIERNESLEVVKAEKGQAYVRNEMGEMRVVNSRQAKSFDVFERQAIEIAAGDKLLLTANRRGKGFRATNGEIVTVSRIDHDNRIHLQDGRVLPKDYRQFSYGYAVTAHRSQGKTVDAVIISGDGMKKELFYVAATRGREGIAVVTSDKDRLRESIGCSTMRQSASELARKRRPGLHQGIGYGMKLARHLAAWAARQMGAVFKRGPMAEQVIDPKIQPTINPSIHSTIKPPIQPKDQPAIQSSVRPSNNQPEQNPAPLWR
jgi:conjugative relaxase-like TrwC/TraI family protein